MVLVSAEDHTWCLKEIITTVCQQSMVLGLNFSCISFTEVYSMEISVKYSFHHMIFPPIKSFYISTSTFKIVENIRAFISCSSCWLVQGCELRNWREPSAWNL